MTIYLFQAKRYKCDMCWIKVVPEITRAHV